MEPTRIFDLLDRINQLYASKDDMLAAKENSQWVKYNAKTYTEYANYFSYGLLSLGYQSGDKIITVSNNRPEWNFIDMGMNQAGLIHVPVYPTLSFDEFEYIFEHSDAKILILSDKFLYKKLKPIADKIQNIKEVYVIDDVEGIKNWKEIVEAGKKAESFEIKQKLQNIKDGIKPTDLCTIIYTSGTTGTSKGVMLTHDNFLYQSRKIKEIVDINETHIALSFLPLCHVLERIVNYSFQYLGTSIYYAQGFETVAENIKEVKPHVFTTVPRLLERVYDKIISKGKQLTGYKKNLFFWAVDLAHQFEFTGKSPVYKAKLALANQLIFSQWRKALGGNVKFVIAGGAALQPSLATVFWAAGIPVREGYGLTETAPIIAFNRQNWPGIKIGYVGQAIGDEQEIKIAEDGEILFRGPNLMLGYYKNPELTKEVIDEEGWFHTGDVGLLDEEKFLKITDRKKEIFKLSTGKYIAPQVIENILKQSFFIEQAMVVGENEKFPGAIISPNLEYLHNWASENHIEFRTNDELVENQKVIDVIKKEIMHYNKEVGSVEQVKVFKLICDEWTPGTGELSPTLKIKRKYVTQKYDHLIQKMYTKK